MKRVDIALEYWLDRDNPAMERLYDIAVNGKPLESILGFARDDDNVPRLSQTALEELAARHAALETADPLGISRQDTTTEVPDRARRSIE